MVDVATLLTAGRQAGLCAVGVCRADPFDDTAQILKERKAEGLHNGMQFTYRNPARSTEPERIVPGATALIVGALDYYRPVSAPPEDGQPRARVAAYARADYYSNLRRALAAVAAPLQAEGYAAVVVADENSLVDRAAAYRAGIGWWGKSANILVRGAGSMVVLGAVVTDAPIRSDDLKSAPVPDGCGSCRRCLDGCPTEAIVAPGVVDARRCLAWLVQAEGVFDPRFRESLGDRLYGCDDCGDVCPPNRVRFRRNAASAAPEQTESNDWVSVLDLLDASDDELMSNYGRWYIPRRQPRYLRRNALIVLGNVGDNNQPRVRAAVKRALNDTDPLIVAHAVWCARRLNIAIESLSLREHPLVKAELERSVTPRASVPRISLSKMSSATACQQTSTAVAISPHNKKVTNAALAVAPSRLAADEASV